VSKGTFYFKVPFCMLIIGLSKRIIVSIIRDNKERDVMDAVRAVEIQRQRGEH